MKLANDIRDMIHDTYFLKKTVLLAVPVAMQGLLNTVVNLVDNLMIGSLGATAIASVGLANKVFFVFSLLVFGVVSGSGILAAQYWGNHDVKYPEGVGNQPDDRFDRCDPVSDSGQMESQDGDADLHYQ